MKKSLAVLMCAMLLITLLPTTAFADDTPNNYTLRYNREDSKLHIGTSSTLYDGNGSWSGSGTTLTLNNFSFTTSAVIALDLNNVENLVLIGTNTVTSTINAEEAGSKVSYAISRGSESLTFSGGGTLTATGGAGSNSYGVSAGNGAITVNGCSITGIGSAATGNSYGVFAREGISVKNGGSITGIGDTGSTSYGVYAGSGNIIASDSTLEGTGSEVGICAPNGAVSLTNSTVTASGGTAISACGITVNSGVINATSTGDTGAGLYSNQGNGSITINGGEVTARATGANSWGIYADSASVTVKRATVIAEGVKGGVGTGEDSSQHVTVSEGATLTATGGAATGTGSYGVRAGGNIVVNGGTLTATGGTSTGGMATDNGSYGMRATGSVTVSAGTVLAKGNSAALNSNAFESYKNPKVSTAISGTPTVDFEMDKLDTYKYLRIAPSSASNHAFSSTVTVYNDPSQPNATVWLTGSGLDGSDLLITERDPQGSAYKAMLRLADSGDVFNTYNIYLRSGKKSTGSAMHLTFDLDAKYAGQDFTLVHQKADGTYEYFYDTADANGDLTFGPLYELSPFMLVKGRLVQTAFASLTDAPKTGDSTQTVLWVCAALIAAALLAGVTLRKQRRD